MQPRFPCTTPPLCALGPLALAAALALSLSLSPSPAVAQDGVGEGVFTAEQAERGRAVYIDSCANCHGQSLEGEGASALAGPAFARAWGQRTRSVDDLFYLIRTQMPTNRGGSLSDDEYLAVLAYILEQNGYGAGESPLVADPAQLTAMRIEYRGEPADERVAPDFIEGEKGLVPEATGPTHAELLAAADNPRDWLFHTHDYTGRRYSALDQIDRGNVQDLSVVCAYQMGELSNFQTGPIVYDGTMYLTTVHKTAALDAATCEHKWVHTWSPQDQEVWLNNRGVAVKDGRVVRATSDGYLFALDAADGELLWARHAASPERGETFTMPPMIYDDLILVGPAGSENAIKGWVGAFSLHDGEPVWRFNIVPRPGEPGSETWDIPLDFPVGGGAVWTPFSLDVEDEILFVAATNPAPDFPAALRGGDNLYTNALLALNVRTGELVWYDQMVPADDHDWDLTQVSPLMTVEVDGQQRNVVTTVGKDGILRTVDRDTQERLYETPVTTIKNAEAPVTTEGTWACPGILGGVEWSGPAYNPNTNLLYTPAVDWCGTYTMAEEDDLRYIPGENYLGGTYQVDEEWGGWVTAVDASDGSVRWKHESDGPMIGGVTTTAGGLVLTGELNGSFLILDAETGDELYRFQTGGPIGGGVVSYEVDGTQYLAIMSGRPSGFWYAEHSGSPTAFVFALK